jgi:hypothetical protein
MRAGSTGQLAPLLKPQMARVLFQSTQPSTLRNIPLLPGQGQFTPGQSALGTHGQPAKIKAHLTGYHLRVDARAFKAVKQPWPARIDKVSIQMFATNLDQNLRARGISRAFELPHPALYPQERPGRPRIPAVRNRVAQEVGPAFPPI